MESIGTTTISQQRQGMPRSSRRSSHSCPRLGVTKNFFALVVLAVPLLLLAPQTVSASTSTIQSRKYGIKAISSRSSITSYGLQQQHRQTQDYTTDADTSITILSEDNEEAKKRVDINPFSVLMTPSPYELDRVGQDEIYRVLEGVIQDYIKAQQATFPNVGLEYVLLGDMESVYQAETGTGVRRARRLTGTTTLAFSSGVTSFVGGGVIPTEEQVNTWVQQAVDSALTTNLQGTNFYYVDDSNYVAGGLGERPDTQGESSGTSAGVVVGAVLAGLAAVALVALFAVKRRNSRVFDVVLDDGNYNNSKAGDDADTVNDSYEKDLSPLKQSKRNALADADNNSVSEWTVNTEAGDTTALKSINTSKMLLVVPAMVNTESFERDRPVALRKDMLTSAWSGRATGSRAVHSESVLQPSHFTASAERRVRDQQEFSTDSSWSHSEMEPPIAPAASGGINAVVDNVKPSPFVFESHESGPTVVGNVGEEIYLMPPSRATRARVQPDSELL